MDDRLRSKPRTHDGALENFAARLSFINPRSDPDGIGADERGIVVWGKPKKFPTTSLLFGLTLILFLVSFFRLLPRYTTPYNFAYYSERYQHSQYVEGEGSRYIISDYDLYSFAGHYYATGGEISRVNFENPPLGKYLIGLSIHLFNNQVVIYLIYAGVYLYITYKFGLLIFKRREIALLGITLLVIDPYFLHAISMPLLDFPMAAMFLTGFYLFFTAKNWRRYFLSSLCFGLALATKFFPFFAVILALLILYQWHFRRSHLRMFLSTIPLIFLVYTVTFAEFFLNQHKNLIDFLHYQWWVIRWRMGNPVVIGNILTGILTGRARVWWTDQIDFQYWTEEWSPLMPIVVVTAFVSSLILRQSHFYKIICIYLVIFMFYIIFVTEGGLKYLAPLYPFFTLFTAATLVHLWEKRPFQ